MAACKLAGVAQDRKLLGKILANKPAPQILAGYKVFFSPQILEAQSDSFCDSEMSGIASCLFPGVLWLYLLQHIHIICTPKCWPAPELV